MLIGIDFDNTVVCHDFLFHTAAVDQGLIPPSVPVAKGMVRDYLRQHGREDDWTALQGFVYGFYMKDAPAFPGALDFLAQCKRMGIPVRIVSHRTPRPFKGPPFDLHKAAHEWLEHNGFYSCKRTGLTPDRVYLEPTLELKLSRIGSLGCSHFIDDLPEFLSEPRFPAGVERILFDPNGADHGVHDFLRATSWAEIQETLLNGPGADL